VQVVVTAAGTPLGQALLRALAARGSLQRPGGEQTPLKRIIGVDRSQPSELFLDERVEYVRGEYAQPRFLARMMGACTDSVFHLAAWAAAEGAGADAEGLESALVRSWDTTHSLADACRLQSFPPRLVFAGRAGLRARAGDIPASTEAVCAGVCESLLAEAARIGLFDLRSVRLPAPCRPGEDPLRLARWSEALIAAHELAAVHPAVQVVDVASD